MTSNFYFLKPEFPSPADSAANVEALAHPNPRAACFYARRTLELVVRWLYDNDTAFHKPYDDSLASLLTEPSFAKNVRPDVLLKAKALKQVGNLAVHGNKPIHQYDAIQAAGALFDVLYWFARTYSKDWKHEGLKFDPALLPRAAPAAGTAAAVAPQTAEQLKKLEESLKQKDAEIADKAKKLADTDAEIAKLKAEVAVAVAEAKKRAALVPDTHDYSEAETRKFFIDLLLREAGWGVKGWKYGEDIEYPVTGMPTQSGEGFVDYVLWGDDGRPLGLVEAKRTSKDAGVGQQQAKLYGDCLEKKFGRRPVIFYSNAYETWLWDDHFYPPRLVQGFYKKDELELLIARRIDRKNPAAEKVRKGIVERYYQEEAIRAVTETLAAGHRKALVVMATGAGKTRTVIALVELLQRCNWVKRVLFLADRVALVNQAIGAFKKHLPDSAPVNLVTEKAETGSRVYVSTYPTILNLIDEGKGGDGARRFGPGYFDLIVVDEAHRSVYQKYRAIFEYFDSLLIGLTATPRGEVDRDTYRLFDLPSDLPTYAYELAQAVKDGFLVPPRPVSVPLKFAREGITYDDLSDAEKEQWDALEWDDESGEPPDHVDAAAVNKWLFNTDTVDKVLAHLLTSGQKVAGGDRLAKTIIFAKNHDHARFIEQRYNINFPGGKGLFARVIDHYEPYAQSILDDFSQPEKMPHLAISVDMLDTGIDVPEAANLVFFKIVRSKTKFLQMIGRGTRLCAGLFGPGMDKAFFYVFDYCQNLEFFRQNAAGVEGNVQLSLGAQLFLHRLEVHHDTAPLEAAEGGGDAATADGAKARGPIAAQAALPVHPAPGEVPQGAPLAPIARPRPMREMRTDIADILHREVAAMNVDNFIVRMKRRDVEKYAKREAWNGLAAEEYGHVGRTLAGLPSELPPEDETAKRFDLLILKLQLAILNTEPKFERLRKDVREIAGALEEKKDIPMVAAQMPLILEIQTDEYWQDVTLPQLDTARKRLRDLVRFIDRTHREAIYTTFDDEIGPAEEISLADLPGVGDFALYRKKVMAFLKDHETHTAIYKLRHNQPVTPTDLVELDRLLFESGGMGSRQQFERVFGKQEHLGDLVRRLVGLDREAAKQAFAEFLQGAAYTASQIRFVNQVIDHLTQNGVMDASLLYEPPYTDFSTDGVEALFPETADKLFSILAVINANAGAALPSAMAG